jgi:hypothetical protein
MHSALTSLKLGVALLVLALLVGWGIMPTATLPATAESAPTHPAAAHPKAAALPSHDAPAAPNDSLDFAAALNTGPDGSVWLAMRTDTGTGGAVQYDADLAFLRRWSILDIPYGVTVHPSGDVFLVHQLRVPHQSTLVRYAPDGNRVHTWDILEAYAMQIDTGPGGALFTLEDIQSPHALTPPPPNVRRIGHYTADGTRVHRWDVDIRTTALAVDTDGRVFAGDRAGPLGGSGNILRFGAGGGRETSWVVMGEPSGMGVLPNGQIAVLHLPELANRARIEIFSPDGQSIRAWNVPQDVPTGGYVEAIDLATGPACDIYALVNLRPENARVLYHYRCDGTLIHTLRDFVQLTGPLQTAAPPITRTPTPTGDTATPTPTSTGTPYGPSDTPTLTLASTSTPTSTPTPSVTRTPTPCPRATPQRLRVDPVTSPTMLRRQVIRASLGYGEWIEVVAPLGTFRQPGDSVAIDIPLAPGQLNHVVVRGHVRQTGEPGGCQYGNYTLTTTQDIHGKSLDIEQRAGVYLPWVGGGAP